MQHMACLFNKNEYESKGEKAWSRDLDSEAWVNTPASWLCELYGLSSLE